MRRLFCAVVLASVLPLSAQAIQPTDFAFGSPVETLENAVVDPGSARLYVANLPVQVYQSVARNDLSDVAVFDARGVVLPFALRRPAQAGTRIARMPLPFFPVRAPSEETVDSSAMRVTRDASGRLSEIQTDAAPRRETVVSAYVIDASQVRKPISALVLEWPQGSQADTAMVQVTLEASNDLKTWRGAGQGVVSRLGYGGQTLEQRRPERSLPWWKWLVWLALAIGVAVLAWMAIRLLRDIGAQPEEGRQDDNAAR